MLGQDSSDSIRDQSSSTSQTKKPISPAARYLAYAIGEIALVVIGILLALQINNWNEGQLLRKEEFSTLNALYDELSNNSDIIDSSQMIMHRIISYGDTIRRAIDPYGSNISDQYFMILLGRTGFTPRCNVTTDVLEELRSTGNLKIISNISLRRKIGRWSSALNELRKEEDDWALEFYQQYIPFTSKWISWADIDFILNKDDPRYFKTHFKYDPKRILKEFEFSNQFEMHYWRMTRIEERLKLLSEITDDIVVLLDSELKN